jgi:Tfp pilus assembly protein PilF/uncharacterized caspase-like protein
MPAGAQDEKSGGRRARVVKQKSPPARELELVPSVAELPIKSKRWALIVGIDDYDDKQIKPLIGAANDAKVLKDALVTYAGFPKEQVILLASNQSDAPQPTRVNILRRLSNLANHVQKDGLLLVAFSGHGIERKGEGYLLASDSQTSDDIEFLEETSISVTRMRERIRATGAGQIVMLLDACRNSPDGNRDGGEGGGEPMSAAFVKGFNFDERNRQVTAFAILYATEVGHYAYEFKEKRQGYFTWAVVEGIKGRAANEQGEVTLGGLTAYVEEVVPKIVRAELGKEQKPFSFIGGYKASKLVLSLANGPRPNTESAAEESEWNAVKTTNDLNTLEDFRRRYPGGIYDKLAYIRIKRLREEAREKEAREELEETRRKLEEKATYSKTFNVEKKQPGLAGRLYITLDGIKYTEYGKRSSSINNFVISCEEIKEAKENRPLPLPAMNVWSALGQMLATPPSDFHLKYWDQKVDLYPLSLSANDKNLILGAVHGNCGDRLGAAGSAMTRSRAEAENYIKEGINSAREGEWADAEAHFKRAAEVDPGYAHWHAYLGVAAEERGKWDDAEAHFREALRLEPEQAQWHIELGRVLKRQRQGLEEAEAHFRRAVELTVNDPEALNELGSFLVEQPGKTGEALTILERAEEAAPYDGQVRVALGWAYFMSGSYDVAERYLSSAAKVAPDLAEAQERLGDYYSERGQSVAARRAWKRALSLSTRPEDKAKLRVKLGAETKSRQ